MDNPKVELEVFTHLMKAAELLSKTDFGRKGQKHKLRALKHISMARTELIRI